MDKTIEVGGVQYTASRRTNRNKNNISYYRHMINVFYEAIASDCNATHAEVIETLTDYAYISGQVTGGVALLNRYDTSEQIQEKCKRWFEDPSLSELGDVLVNLVYDVNTTQPDIALSPDPLPENADPNSSPAE